MHPHSHTASNTPSGNALASINIVALHQTQLVLKVSTGGWTILVRDQPHRSIQPSTLNGTVNEYQLSGRVIIINDNGGCRLEQPTDGVRHFRHGVKNFFLNRQTPDGGGSADLGFSKPWACRRKWLVLEYGIVALCCASRPVNDSSLCAVTPRYVLRSSSVCMSCSVLDPDADPFSWWWPWADAGRPPESNTQNNNNNNIPPTPTTV